MPGAFVHGWPSKGGVYVFSTMDGVEMDFMGLDRFHTTLRPPKSAEEDALCGRMRQLGAA